MDLSAALTADYVDKRAKSSDKTTIINFLLFLEHWRAPVPFTWHSIFASGLTLRAPLTFSEVFNASNSFLANTSLKHNTAKGIY